MVGKLSLDLEITNLHIHAGKIHWTGWVTVGIIQSSGFRHTIFRGNSEALFSLRALALG